MNGAALLSSLGATGTVWGGCPGHFGLNHRLTRPARGAVVTHHVTTVTHHVTTVTHHVTTVTHHVTSVTHHVTQFDVRRRVWQTKAASEGLR